MDALEKETNGRWKPSPGSIYPLLAWLQDNGYTKEVPTDGAGIKRYVLTEKGEQFFQEQIKLKEKLEEKLRFLTPTFLGGLFPEKLRPIVEPMKKLAKSLFDLRANISENTTDQAVKEVADLLERTADNFEELNKKIKGEKSK
jgi:DNA-binding PadR family transcriptional regulator